MGRKREVVARPSRSFLSFSLFLSFSFFFFLCRICMIKRERKTPGPWLSPSFSPVSSPSRQNLTLVRIAGYFFVACFSYIYFTPLSHTEMISQIFVLSPFLCVPNWIFSHARIERVWPGDVILRHGTPIPITCGIFFFKFFFFFRMFITISMCKGRWTRRIECSWVLLRIIISRRTKRETDSICLRGKKRKKKAHP